MTYVEEFQRYKDGPIHIISFNGEGEILAARIWDKEIAKEYPDGISLQLPLIDYWRRRVHERLFQLRAEKKEQAYWELYRDAGNE